MDIDTYLSVSVALAELRSLGAEAADHLDAVASAVAAADASPAKAFDTAAAYEAITAASSRLRDAPIDPRLADLVRTLQRHVSAQDGSAAAFLRRHDAYVTSGFADLCEECGVPLPGDVVAEV